jgi:hypothetical protein
MAVQMVPILVWLRAARLACELKVPVRLLATDVTEDGDLTISQLDALCGPWTVYIPVCPLFDELTTESVLYITLRVEAPPKMYIGSQSKALTLACMWMSEPEPEAITDMFCMLTAFHEPVTPKEVALRWMSKVCSEVEFDETHNRGWPTEPSIE